MLNFAEQTGSGAVIVVWSFLLPSHKKLLHKATPPAASATEPVLADRLSGQNFACQKLQLVVSAHRH